MTVPIGEQLKQWRQARGISLRGLAQRAGISASTLSEWEAGKHAPRLPELEAVLEVLHIPAGERRLLRAAFQTAPPQDADASAPLPVWGDLLRAMRVRQGRTQAETAAAVGVGQGRLTRWERSEDWPSPERLERLCGVLNAHPEEQAALLRGQFRLWEDLGEISEAALDEYQARYGFLRSPELVDLHGLVWERLAWKQSQRQPEPHAVVAWAYMCHAYWSTIWQRGRVTLLPAQTSVNLYSEVIVRNGRSKGEFVTGWTLAWEAYAYALSVSSPQGNHRAAKTLENVLPMASESERANLLSGMAYYETQQGKFERALALDAASDRIEMQTDWYSPTLAVLGNYDRAHILLTAGRAEEALSLMPSSFNAAGTPFQRGAAARVWAEVCVSNRAWHSAQFWLAAMQTLLATEQLPHLRSQMETLSERVAQQ